jgi:hypothetical protein
MGSLKSRELRGVVESRIVHYGKDRRVQCKYILTSQKHRDGKEVVKDEGRNIF